MVGGALRAAGLITLSLFIHAVAVAPLIKRETVDLRAAPGISHLISPPSIPPVSRYFQRMEAALSAPDWRGAFLIRFALRVIRRAAAAVETDCFQRGTFISLFLRKKNKIILNLFISAFKKEREPLSSMMFSFVVMLDTHLTF